MCATAASCQPYEPQQQRLLPDALQDGLPEECAGGGHDYSYNVYAAVDEAERIVVVAELSCNAADSECLPVLLAAVKANLGQDTGQVLAEAGFRSEAVFEQLKDSPSELIVTLGSAEVSRRWRS